MSIIDHWEKGGCRSLSLQTMIRFYFSKLKQYRCCHVGIREKTHNELLKVVILGMNCVVEEPSFNSKALASNIIMKKKFLKKI